MKIKVRLKRHHYHNSIRKAPGNVIRVREATAEWLVSNKIAEFVKRQ
jgi:hypothetical protein